MDDMPGRADSSAAKVALRDQVLTARRRRSLAAVGQAARDLSRVLLATPELQRAATVAAYVSVGQEPGTGPLLDALAARGRRVLLPVLLPDRDLDWAAYDGRLAPARLGLLEPEGPRLGVEAVAGADVVLVPGLAADRSGHRLGRGGGSYDRALARVPVDTPTWVLLYDGEVVAQVPREPHDRPVTGAALPGGVIPLSPARG